MHYHKINKCTCINFVSVIIYLFSLVVFVFSPVLHANLFRDGSDLEVFKKITPRYAVKTYCIPQKNNLKNKTNPMWFISFTSKVKTENEKSLLANMDICNKKSSIHNFKKIIQLSNVVAKQESAIGLTIRGFISLRGINGKIDNISAYKDFQAASILGEGTAENFIGEMVKNGRIKVLEHVKFELSPNKIDKFKPEYKYGYLTPKVMADLTSSLLIISGLSKKLISIHHYLRAIRMGSVQAQLSIGSLFFDGFQLSSEYYQDTQLAKYLFKSASERGWPNANTKLIEISISKNGLVNNPDIFIYGKKAMNYNIRNRDYIIAAMSLSLLASGYEKQGRLKLQEGWKTEGSNSSSLAAAEAIFGNLKINNEKDRWEIIKWSKLSRKYRKHDFESKYLSSRLNTIAAYIYLTKPSPNYRKALYLLSLSIESRDALAVRLRQFACNGDYGEIDKKTKKWNCKKDNVFRHNRVYELAKKQPDHFAIFGDIWSESSYKKPSTP